MIIGYWRCPDCEERPKTMVPFGSPPIMLCGECATELEFVPTGDTEQIEFTFVQKMNGKPFRPINLANAA